MITRRRFLAVTACAATVPAAASAGAERWRGVALGAEAEIVLYGPSRQTGQALAEARAQIAAVERAFSLYDPGSELSRLNRDGRLEASPLFLDLVALAGRMHDATGGLFDPTIQPLWRALAEGRETGAAREALGWPRVRREGARIVLDRGQALTFNGIAQGFATDLVAARLRRRGFSDILVNIGEFSGHGRPWRLGLSDPVHGLLGARTLVDGAIATSSPGAMPLAGAGHILHPAGGEPFWSTVSVEARTAALADGLSTALCLAPRDRIAAIRSQLPEVRHIALVTRGGDLVAA